MESINNRNKEKKASYISGCYRMIAQMNVIRYLVQIWIGLFEQFVELARQTPSGINWVNALYRRLAGFLLNRKKYCFEVKVSLFQAQTMLVLSVVDSG